MNDAAGLLPFIIMAIVFFGLFVRAQRGRRQQKQIRALKKDDEAAPDGGVRVPQAAGSGALADAGGPAQAPAQTSLGQKVRCTAALVGLVGFVLPWVSCVGLGKMSGFDLATKGGAGGLWLVPISFACVLVSFLSRKSKGNEVAHAERPVKWDIGFGAAAGGTMLVEYARVVANDQWGFARAALQIELGAFISLLGAAAVCVGGFLDLADLKARRQPRARDRAGG